MGIRNTPLEEWIELDCEYPRFHREKAIRIEDRGPKCCRTLPDAYDAALELLEQLAEYLPSRYPMMYRRIKKGIQNIWSGEKFDIISRPLHEDPMQTIGRLTQDDMAIMIEKDDGNYYFLAGAILLAGFWRLEDKLGLSLREIHTTAGVPHYEERLEKGMNNLFRRLKPEDLVTRNNFSIQIDSKLPWSTSIGNEDSNDLGWHNAEDNIAIEHHHLRVERQSLRRLPRTGAIIFTIHTYLTPITDLAKEDYVPGRLGSAIRSYDGIVSEYKGRPKYREILLNYLDEQHKKQIDRGLVLDEEDSKRQYPW
ncbi:alpha-1-2-mannosyltransferase [Penicillium angulare]|uniref:Alpha-1-2-mannosyltransferase n=1 Tax=Penicillium angulare TaxID=116970 RepID=A0A9W9FZI8_9EURO|nr:alpha-1-2-mannosyltransferase [Penicillium angulare]